MKEEEAIKVIIEDFMVTYAAPGLLPIWGRQHYIWENLRVSVDEVRPLSRPTTNFERQQVKNRCDRKLSICDNVVLHIHRQPDTVYVLTDPVVFKYHDAVVETVEQVAKMLDFKVVYDTNLASELTTPRRPFITVTSEEIATYVSNATSPFGTVDLRSIYDAERPL